MEVRHASWWVVLIALLTLALPFGRAHGQAAAEGTVGTPADAEALARFDAGRLAFEAGRYGDALSDFQRSYELSGRAWLLYNIGETLARLDRREEALSAFESYLRETSGDAPNRAQVESRVAILRRSLEAERAEATEPVGSTLPIDSDEDRGDDSSSGGGADGISSADSDPAPWIVVGVSAALVVAGGVLVGVAASDRAAVESARPPTFYSDAASTADRVPALEGSGGALLGIGVTGVIGGLIWGVVQASGRGDSSVAVDARGVTVRWSL